MSLQKVCQSRSRQVVWTVSQSVRAYSVSIPRQADVQAQAPAPTEPPNPEKAATLKELRQLRKAKLNPLGSRRRRAALREGEGLPFEQLPYQCFQEARKVLAADRELKLKKVEAEKARIAHLEQRFGEDVKMDPIKKGRLMALRRHLETLKIQADINDPVIKKKFEDGQVDMDKPIYRFLADQKWRSYNRKLLMQRIETMHVVPDVYAHLDPTVEVRLAFRQRDIFPGEFAPSLLSEIPPALKIQPFNKGPRYYTILVVDPDVPDFENDTFNSRSHFLASNIIIEPNQPHIALTKLPKEHIVHEWVPPTSQKGSPYHRLCVFVLEQPGRLDPYNVKAGTTGETVMGQKMDVTAMKEEIRRDDMSFRWFRAKYGMHPVGFHMFRTTWDDWMAAVMKRNGIEGAEVELKRKKTEKLPAKKRNTARYRGHR